MARGQAGSGAHLAPAGRDSSQDERGACALLSTQLSSLLGERPVTHREVQGNESDLFMDYFPRGLTYQVWGSPGVLGVLPQYSAFRPGSQHPRWVPGVTAGLSAPSALCFILAEHYEPPGVLGTPRRCSASLLGAQVQFLSTPLGAGHCAECSAPLLDVGHPHQTLSTPTGCWAPH